MRRPVIASRRSGWLIEAIKTAYTLLGLGEAVGDWTFEQMVAARLIEPISKAAPRALVRDRLAGTGPPRHPAGLSGALRRAGIPRAPLPRSLFDHVTATRGLALCLQA